jgi:L,D-transpeptidase ErfK/SrfK
MRKAIAYAVWAGLAAAVAPGAGHGGEATRAGDLIGARSTETIKAEDTLLDVARRHDLGFVELRAANPRIDPWLPKPGIRVTIPNAHILPDTPRSGVVVNLADQRLYFFRRKSATVTTYPLGTPRDGKRIPLGVTKIVGKRKNPTWHPPASLRKEFPELPAAIPPGPDNPLGDFALDMGWVGFVIHGTNKPYGIGRRVSAGCIRLYPEDIVRLFKAVKIGETVTVINQPAKAGWSGGRLYLEIHPDGRAVDAIEESGRADPAVFAPLPDLRRYLTEKAGRRAGEIDWRRVEQAATERTGIPMSILGRP